MTFIYASVVMFGTILAVPALALEFREVTNSVIDPNTNLARTKDADVADIDNNGFLDILDANSNNSQNGTDVVVRFNNGLGFTTQIIGPRDNTVSYDSDLVDLNGDNFPDLIRTESSGSVRRVSVYRNRGGGQWFDLAVRILLRRSSYARTISNSGT